jgi:hypothetical protein
MATTPARTSLKWDVLVTKRQQGSERRGKYLFTSVRSRKEASTVSVVDRRHRSVDLRSQNTGGVQTSTPPET